MEHISIIGGLFILLTGTCLFLYGTIISKASTKLSGVLVQRITKVGMIFIGLWLIILWILSFTGVLMDFSSKPPKMFVVLLVPLITLILLLTIKTSRKIIAEVLIAIEAKWLILFQSFRILVELILWYMFLVHILPEILTFEGRNWDILAGLTAPMVVFFALRKNQFPFMILILWNILCLGLLINVVATAVLSFPTPFQYFFNEVPNTVFAQFPHVLLPGILVPMAYYSHVLSIYQIILQKKKKIS